MKQNWKYVLPVAATSLSLFTSIVNADATTDSAQMRNLENRVNTLEQRKGAGGMINPQGRPQVKDGADLFVFGNLLYWNAHESGLNVAVKQEINHGSGAENLLDDSKVENLRGKWNWGFRAGIGYNTPHDGWDLKATWLRFTDTSHLVRARHSNETFYPTLAMPAQLSAADSSGPNADAYKATGYWGLNLNQLDLDMGREFFVSKWLTLRPHAGLRTDWIHQNVKGRFFGVASSAPWDVVVKMKDHWWGLGLEGGLDSQWGLGNGWSIFANAASAILYGFHEINVKNVNENIHEPHNAIIFADLHNFVRLSHPILDLQLGFRWDHMFCNDRFHIGFDLGWEHHVFFSQNQFPMFTDAFKAGAFAVNQGDLTTQGFTFATRFDF